MKVCELRKVNIAMRDRCYVGELNCRTCGVKTDVKVGGILLMEVGESRGDRCPECGEGGRYNVYWMNTIMDWDARYCLFIVGEVEV